MVHSDAISNDVLEDGTAENFKSNDAKWCICRRVKNNKYR